MFRAVVSGIITNKGEILIGKKENEEGHPSSGEYILPGGHLEDNEELEKALIREVKEETNLEVEIYQLVDAYSKFYESSRSPMIRFFFHCDAKERNALPQDDLTELKWVKPQNISQSLGETDGKLIQERERIQRFIRKFGKMPSH